MQKNITQLSLRRLILAGLSLAGAMASTGSLAMENLSAEDSIQHLGEIATVCGKVAQVATFSGETFINLERKHPNQVFYFYFPDVSTDTSRLQSKFVCGSGLIERHKGKAQIVINSPANLTIYTKHQ